MQGLSRGRSAFRLGATAALGLLASACSSGIVPRAASNQPAPSRREASAHGVPAPRRATPAPRVAEAAGLRRTPATAAPFSPVPVAAPVVSPANAAQAGVVAGPAVASLPIDDATAAAALAAFRTSCPSLVRRTDASGLTRGADWQPACDAASAAAPGEARGFFARWFETVQVGDGRAFATGYYEPEISGSRERRSGYDTPIYAKPNDLIEVDLGLFSKDLVGKKIRGRVDGQKFVPYYDRGQIEDGALAGRGLELGWAADPVELFFLEVQGSGRVRLADGSVMRLGYAAQNGRDYVGIGALMRDRGLLAPGQASMQGIMGWLRAHPDEGRAIMRENKSYVFFRELTGPGPIGALGVAVAGEVSAAADPKFVPLGAPLFLSLDRPEATGLWVAQDTGGAIKGANRVDTFWGAGERARTIAGGMSGRGAAFLLVPLGTLARLQQPSGG